MLETNNYKASEASTKSIMELIKRGKWNVKREIYDQISFFKKYPRCHHWIGL